MLGKHIKFPQAKINIVIAEQTTEAFDSIGFM